MIKSNNKVVTNLHGEANDMIDEEREIIMSPWRKYFYARIVEVDTPPEFVYNACQNGLYYQNLPNRVYINEANKKGYYGVKLIKYKTRITFMVGTSASGKKVPLAVVGKPKNPECFKLMDGARSPLPYKNQANSSFDQKSHYGGFSIFSDHITSALKSI